MSDARRRAEEALRGSDVPAFPRNDLLRQLRKEAQRPTRGDRLVILCYGEAKDAVAAWDAEHAARLAAEGEAGRLRDLLRLYQFCVPIVEGFGPVERSLCPECDQTEERGHAPDCRIGALLAEAPSGGGPAEAPEVHVPRAEGRAE